MPPPFNHPFSIVFVNPQIVNKMRYILSILLLLLITAPFSSLVSQEYKGAFHIEQERFEEINDSLYLTFQLTLDAQLVPTCSSMIFEPRLEDEEGNNAIVFPYIQVNGEVRARLNRRWFSLCSQQWLESYQRPYLQINIHKYKGEQLPYAFHVPYQPWMDQATLILHQEIIDCGGKAYQYTYKLDSKVTLQPREPYQVRPLMAMVTPPDEVKTRNRQGSAFLDFQVNRSVILPDFRRNPVELGKINEAMTDVVADTDAQITGLFIEGYASPEGSYTNNERLARERATALKDYLRNRYMMNEEMFTVRYTAEDWEGLKALVENSDLPQKERVISIIDSSDEPDRKERNLKKLAVYNRLLKDFFPDLRRVEYQIDYTVRNYSNAEAKDLVNSHPQNLSQAELYRLAQSYGENIPEYKRILMEIIPQYYPDNSIALTNAAALLLENAEVNTAIRLLEKAQDLPAAWNNLGAAFLYLGEIQKAEELFNQAATAGIGQAVHNLEEVRRKKEDDLKQMERNSKR